MAQQANAAPMNCPNCCLAGVAPTRNPVFRSCEMSPAFDAAMQTTVPTVRMAARADGSLHPQSTNTTETPRSVTSVIADVGFDETPIKPTMRDDTTTKQIPKMATPNAATSRGPKDMLPAKRFGTRTSVITTATGTTATKIGGMSRSVLCGAPVPSPALSCLSPLTTAENDLHIVGNARATATIP